MLQLSPPAQNLRSSNLVTLSDLGHRRAVHTNRGCDGQLLVIAPASTPLDAKDLASHAAFAKTRL